MRELQDFLKFYAQASGMLAPLCRRVLMISEKDPLICASLLCTGVEDAGFFVLAPSGIPCLGLDLKCLFQGSSVRPFLKKPFAGEALSTPKR